MPYIISFNNTRYHLNDKMQQWCNDSIGHGGWTYNTPETWEGMNDKVWIIHSMFGRTTFAFKEEKHLTLFLLKWS
jgi:hypothetical protein